MCGMIARDADHFGREPYPLARGPLAAVDDATPRTGTFARAG